MHKSTEHNYNTHINITLCICTCSSVKISFALNLSASNFGNWSSWTRKNSSTELSSVPTPHLRSQLIPQCVQSLVQHFTIRAWFCKDVAKHVYLEDKGIVYIKRDILGTSLTQTIGIRIRKFYLTGIWTHDFWIMTARTIYALKRFKPHIHQVQFTNF